MQSDDDDDWSEDDDVLSDASSPPDSQRSTVPPTLTLAHTLPEPTPATYTIKRLYGAFPAVTLPRTRSLECLAEMLIQGSDCPPNSVTHPERASSQPKSTSLLIIRYALQASYSRRDLTTVPAGYVHRVANACIVLTADKTWFGPTRSRACSSTLSCAT